MIKALVSYYDEQSSPNKTVAMLGSRVCPDCDGSGKDIKKTIELGYQISDPCPRCHGDGLLSNQIPFNSNLMECAIAPSFMEEQGWKLGDVIKLISSYKNCEKCSFKNPSSSCGICYSNKHVTVRITDIMADHLCSCGHTKDAHKCKTRHENDCEYCLGDCNILDECKQGCKCDHYEQRVLDLTKAAFEKLAPLSQGLLEVEIEVVKCTSI